MVKKIGQKSNLKNCKIKNHILSLTINLKFGANLDSTEVSSILKSNELSKYIAFLRSWISCFSRKINHFAKNKLSQLQKSVDGKWFSESYHIREIVAILLSLWNVFQLNNQKTGYFSIAIEIYLSNRTALCGRIVKFLYFLLKCSSKSKVSNPKYFSDCAKLFDKYVIDSL